MQDHAAAHEAGDGVLGCELRSHRAGCCDPGRRHLAADDALAVAGQQPVDTAAVVGQLAPDRQQQAGDDVERALPELGQLGQLRLPGNRECLRLGRPPRRRRQRIDGDRRTLQRPDQPHPALDAAVVEHEAGRQHLHGRAVRLAVDKEAAATLGALVDGIAERQRLVAVAPDDGEHLRLGAGARMGVDRAALHDPQRRRRDGLDADIVGSGRDGAFDLGLQQRLECREQRVLQVYGQCRRQLLLQRPVAVRERKPSRVLEPLQRAALDLARVEQHVELPQRRARVDALQGCGSTAGNLEEYVDLRVWRSS
jgi:hypothetical protein